jgi:ribose transport system ATP-binding protein
MTAPLLEVRGLVKDYPGVRALDGVDFVVTAGQVHCLVGQNGAGKSTLIKCIAGLVTPTEGEVVIDGEPLPPGDPAAALAHGIATIYQELDLVDDLSVAYNLFLGHELRRGPLLDRRAARRETAAVLARLGHEDVAPNSLVGTLAPATRQIVSIARALTRDARLLIMDEPSAVLGRHEVETLFDVVRRLTAEGVGVVYISHRLEEVAAVGDTITVLRDGRTVAADLLASTPRTELIGAMVGRQFAEVFPDRTAPTTATPRPVVLRVEGLTRAPAVSGVSFEVHEGEVVGPASRSPRSARQGSPTPSPSCVVTASRSSLSSRLTSCRTRGSRSWRPSSKRSRTSTRSTPMTTTWPWAWCRPSRTPDARTR